MFVTGTSAVGFRNRSSSPMWYMSPSSFGSCPVPNSDARRITCGGDTSVYPCRSTWKSSMKLMSARSSRAPRPVNSRKREPALLDQIEAREVELHALQGDAGLDLVAMLAQELEIVHGLPGEDAKRTREDGAANLARE